MLKARRSPWSMVFFVLMIAGAALADQPVATVTVSATSVVWTPLIEYSTLRLTVVGPDGKAVIQDYAPGKSPSYQLPGGAANGAYNYELRATPKIPAGVQAALQAARAKNDDAESRQILRDNGIANATQSGTLTVQNGAFLSPAVAEGGNPAAKSGSGAAAGGGGAIQSVVRLKPKADDNVIADDLIVQGSACVGLDCVNNESFGFDTIRLKENNNRIKFDDTSSAGGFANNDWQLTANDSTNGGANKFSIDDMSSSRTPFTIMAGAVPNSLFVDSIGRIGVGTSTPTLDIQPVNLDTPAVRFDQPLGPFAAQAWDIGANEVNFFVRDATHGSLLPFRIHTGAPSNSIDVGTNGSVGIGTDMPGTGVKLDVMRTDSSATVLSVTGNNASGIAIIRAQSGDTIGSIRQSYVQLVSAEMSRVDWRAGLIGSSSYRISDFSTGTEQNRIAITSAGNIGIGGVTSPANPLQHSSGAFLSAGGTWTNASSRELKEDICDLDTRAAEQTLEQLQPVTFRYKAAPTEAHVGFIAEDVPDLVAVEGRKGLSPMDIVAVLTKVVQEQQKTMRDQQKMIDELARKVSALQHPTADR